jgi:hypothetical protein
LEDRPVPEVFEDFPEYANDDPSFARLVFEQATPLMRDALLAIAEASPQRLTYDELENKLGWPPRRWHSVFGGYTQRPQYSVYNGQRPWHICSPERSPRGEWELWMTAPQADGIR